MLRVIRFHSCNLFMKKNQISAHNNPTLKSKCQIPFRLDLAGGWLDQPFVSKWFPGPVLTISIEPDYNFNDRSGMASSTRKKAIELWQTAIPVGEKEQLAKALFNFENTPGTSYISGSQDAVGIVFPGVIKLEYKREQSWPSSITPLTDQKVIDFLEQNLWLVTLSPRNPDFKVLSGTNINTPNAKALADAANSCWEAILARDIKAFGHAFRESFESQIAMFPNMVNPTILEQIEAFKESALGWKLSGAGGGGYLVLVSEKPIQNAIQIRIRR